MLNEEIDMPYRLWVHFSHDCDWYAVCVKTFHDMPEAFMTRYLEEEYPARHTAPFKDIKDALSSRTDAWGLPPHILKGLIFG